MSINPEIHVFGDQIELSRDLLRSILLQRRHAGLSVFLHEVAQSLRGEIQALPLKQRDQFPAFVGLYDLLTLDLTKPLHPALHLALSTIQHLAIYILYRSSFQKEVDYSSCHVAGFGSGVLAAVAISVFPDEQSLLKQALLVVSISFRVGLRAAATAKDLVGQDAILDAWCTKVEADDIEQVTSMVLEFSSQCTTPWHRLYICGTSRDTIWIGGPPTLLQAFVQANNLVEKAVNMHAPFHAPHLFTASDIDAIVQSVPIQVRSMAAQMNILGPIAHFEENDDQETFGSLLPKALDAVFRCRVNGGSILRSLAEKTAHGAFTVVGVGIDADSSITRFLGPSCQFTGSDTVIQLPQGAGTPQQCKLAITGFSGRFPTAENVDEFWNMLQKGTDTHSEVPPNRWDRETHVDPTGEKKNTSATPYGCWLDHPELFDRSFFSISPREAPQMDPAQRLALMCAYEAIEMAGVVPDATPSTAKSRVGVYIGCTSNDWCETNSAQDVDFYFIPGGNRAFIPGRINYHFKFSGPSYAVDTACSSSLAALHLACNALWKGEIDTAIVGGTNILTNPDVTAGLDRGHFLSRTGNCRSFDDSADGYCRGEGVGILVLKRLQDAQAENDNVLACLLSAATNHSAEAESITRPHVGAQQALFSQVLASAGCQPDDVSYVEMHGTGTQAGDSREMDSVTRTFAPYPQSDPRGRANELYVGSVKANVGHGEAVSGVTALIKVLLMLEKNAIVPHCGIIGKLNRNFPPDLDQRGVRIARELTPWLRSQQPRRVLINNFSAAGGNSCILLEDAPEKPKRTEVINYDNRPIHVLTVSAKTKTALEANLRAMARYLQLSHSTPLSNISYTATARRVHYNFRASFAAQTVQEAQKLLAQEIANPPPQFKGPPRMMFTFAGQGSSHAGAAGDIYQRCANFRNELDHLDSIIQQFGFDSVLPYLLLSAEDTTKNDKPQTTQLAHLSLQIALARLWISWGVTPSAVVGHSLGEYAALNISGVLSDFDTIWLCANRADLLGKHCEIGTHNMLVVRSGPRKILSHLDDLAIEMACFNGPEETVLSGPQTIIDEAIAKLSGAGIQSTRMQLPYAFHSSQVVPILDEYAGLVAQAKFRTPSVPILSPLLSEVIQPGDNINPDYLLRQCREPVNLIGAVEAGLDAGLLNERTHLLEIGPALVLSRSVKRMLGVSAVNAVIPSLNSKQNVFAVLATSVATAYRVGCSIDWAQYHRDYAHSVVKLPSYCWDLKGFWLQYVNDWSLRKGDPLPNGPLRQIELSTTSCQEVLSFEHKGDMLKFAVRSNVQRPDLKAVVSGHTVNGIAVCIGAVYVDIATACGNALLEYFGELSKNKATMVHDLDMQEALIIEDCSDSQLITIDVACTWKQGSAKVTIRSAEKVHATAILRFTDPAQEQVQLAKTLAAGQIRDVKRAAANGEADRFTRAMAYRMVASLAYYHPTHKGVKEVYLNSETMEGTSTVSTTVEHRLQGDFAMHPCVLDSILQLATFVMNAHANSSFENEVFVVRGWEKAFMSSAVSDAVEYETYATMTMQGQDMAIGDIIVLSGGLAFGYINGVRAQRVPRRLMDLMFRSKASPKHAPPEKAAQKTVIEDAVPIARTLQTALSIIAEESGHAVQDMKDDDDISGMGIDSLLTIVISSRFREELSIDLSPTFFIEHGTIGAVKSYLNGQNNSSSHTPAGSESKSRVDSSASSETSTGTTTPTEASSVSSHSSAEFTAKTTSAILQGSPNVAKKIMFLFPDGSGSATSYLNIPQVDAEVAVVGINCPYMTKPREMKGSIEDITRIMLAEVQRRQPQGPYYFGGWSAGGAFAFCAATMLLQAGEEVKSLVLIDAPCPVGLGKLPQVFFDFWKTIHEPGGPVADRPIPHWLMDHFQAVNNNLRGYTARALPKGCSPKTFITWAARGTDNLAGFQSRHLLTPEESEDLGFLMDDKTDFGPRGWENLLEGDLVIEVAMTSNHFTIVRGEGAQLLAATMRNACQD